jgi:hypothetical protein
MQTWSAHSQQKGGMKPKLPVLEAALSDEINIGLFDGYT